jgi:hypothetical protein
MPSNGSIWMKMQYDGRDGVEKHVQWTLSGRNTEGSDLADIPCFKLKPLPISIRFNNVRTIYFCQYTGM